MTLVITQRRLQFVLRTSDLTPLCYYLYPEEHYVYCIYVCINPDIIKGFLIKQVMNL